MKNKYISLALLALISSLLFQCKGKKDVGPDVGPPVERIDFDKGAIQIMDTMVNNLTGRWNLSQVEFDIKYPNPTGSVKKDTTFKDFAILEIHSISRTEDSRYPVCKGELILQNQRWPMRFSLMASSERIVQKTGPQAFTLFDWYWPTGSHVWKAEEIFFRDLGLAGENYSIEINYKNGSMLWKGLNRDIKEIRMQKL